MTWSAFTGCGARTLTLTVAQGFNDTHAITSGSFVIAVTDTAANVFANIAALNADTM